MSAPARRGPTTAARAGAACPDRTCPVGPGACRAAADLRDGRGDEAVRGLEGTPCVNDSLTRTDAAMPRQGVLRAVVLALRFVAAAAETGDGACFDAAFAEAEAAFGVRDGALVVARAAALLRAARRDGVALAFLPPACRALSRDETDLLTVLRDRDGSAASAIEPCRLVGSDAVAGALADLAAALVDAAAAAFGAADWTGSELARVQFPLILS